MSMNDLFFKAVAQRSGQTGPLERRTSGFRGILRTALTVAVVLGFFAVNLSNKPAASTEKTKTVQSPATGSPPTSPNETIGTISQANDPESRPLASYNSPESGTTGGSSGGLMVKVAADLGIVVALVLFCAAGWKKLKGTFPQKGVESLPPIRLEATVSLASQRFLHLVEFGGRRMVLASTPQQVTVLVTLESEQVEHLSEQEGADPAKQIESSDWFQNVLSKLDAIGAEGSEAARPVPVQDKPAPMDHAVAVATVTQQLIAPTPKRASLFQFAGSDHA